MSKQHHADQHACSQPNNPENVRKAVMIGQKLMAEGSTKADAVRKMFPLVFEEPREVIWQVFVESVGLTEKGAVTYLYNLRRAHKRGKLKEYFDQ